jgi:hypothetical protein
MRTQRIVKTGIWAVLTCLALGVQAVTVINRTTGQLLFYDDFESVPAVSTNAYPDTSGDYDPAVPASGAWQISELGPTNIQVTAYCGDGTNDPAATPQGTNYLRLVRHTSSVTEAVLVLPSPQNTAGDEIHLEMMVWVPRNVNWGAFQVQLVGSAGVDTPRINVLVEAITANQGKVLVYDISQTPAKWSDTSLKWYVSTWQKWEIDYVIGADTFVLGIDGIKQTLNGSHAGGDIKEIRFRGGVSADNIQFRLDSTGYDGESQKSLTLFRDGFEHGTADSAPVSTIPDIGTYLNVANGVKVRTGDLSANGGPSAAYNGLNYCELTRLNNLGTSLSCMFCGGNFPPDTQELRVRFMMWYDGAGLPSHGIGQNTSAYFSSTNFLAFNLVRGDGSYDAFDGSAYVKIAPAASIPKRVWCPVEMIWYPTNQTVSVSLNNGEPVPGLLFGAVPDILNQLFLTSGINTTVYWVDDIEAEWVYTPPPPPPPPPGGTILFLR